MMALLISLVVLGFSMVACYQDDSGDATAPYREAYTPTQAKSTPPSAILPTQSPNNAPAPILTLSPTKRPTNTPPATPIPQAAEPPTNTPNKPHTINEPDRQPPPKAPIDNPSDTSNEPETATFAKTPAATHSPTPVADLTPRSDHMLSFAPLTPAASDFVFETPTVEEILEHGLFESAGSPVHIAVRAIPETGSVRCEWQNIARTLDQREKLLRFLLGGILHDDRPLPSTSELETILSAFTDQVEIGWKQKLEASYFPLATGRVNTEYLTMYCYADFVTSEYLLGAGPTKFTVAYDLDTQEYTHTVTERIFDTYQEDFEAEGITRDQVPTRAEHNAEYFTPPINDAESGLSKAITARDSVLFLVPLGVYDNIAVEAWQAVAQWDLQMNQGILQAVRHGADQDSPEYRQTYAKLKTRITTAAATDAFAGKRIASISGLNQYYRDIGAYDDITPDDGSDETFMPAMPPPVPTCTGSTTVGTDPDQGLVDDCNTLLDSRNTLVETATLNWSGE